MLIRFVPRLQTVKVVSQSQVEHFFVTGAEPQVNEIGLNFRSPVTVVTIGNETPKKNLILLKMSLD
jgi:hypothetical protein